MPDDLPRQRVGILLDAPHREGIEMIAMAEARCSGFHQVDEALGLRLRLLAATEPLETVETTNGRELPGWTQGACATEGVGVLSDLGKGRAQAQPCWSVVGRDLQARTERFNGCSVPSARRSCIACLKVTLSCAPSPSSSIGTPQIANGAPRFPGSAVGRLAS